MAQHISQLHFHASTHCALCRKRLPEPDYHTSNDIPTEKAWEYEVLGFCNLASSGERPRIFTTRADFKNPSTFTTSTKGGLSVHFCLESECQQCEGGGIVHLIHIPCWKLINLSEKYSSTTLYGFAHSRYPLFDTGDVESEHDSLMDFTTITMQGLHDPLLELFIKLLPLEIRFIISAYCPPNLQSSLHTVRKISRSDVASCHSIIERKYHTVLDSISATQTSILGQQYISSIEFNKNEGILLRGAELKGVMFTIGLYGLRALSFLYHNESSSAWLGSPAGGWTGIMLTKDMKKVRVLYDNLKYLRIDPEDEGVPEVKRNVTRVMWNTVLPFGGTQRHYILDTTARISQVRNFPGWRLCKYLPLIDNSSAISGLTMYLNGHGVTGIATHGRSLKQIGNCQGCSVHIFLRPNERIVSVWLRMPARHVPFENEPSVLVTTSFSRTCLFGPSLSHYVTSSWQYAWTPLIQDSNVVGIFYDALAIRRCGRITNFGISQDVNVQHRVTAKDLPRIPFPLHRPDIRQDMNLGIYFSSSRLDQIKSLQVCQKGPRCIGMSIHHNNGCIDVLGQWDCTNSSFLEVYSENNGILSSINFRLSGGASGFYVSDIFVGIDNEDSCAITVMEQTKLVSLELPNEASVAWWFSRDYDEIKLWEANYEDLNVSTETYNVKELS